MILLKSLLLENALVVRLTPDEVQEILHKLGILESSPDLLEDYNLTQEQASQLMAILPKNGGSWEIPEWGIEAVRGEMADHIEILRRCAHAAYSGGQTGQSLRISKQAKRFETMFGLNI